MKRNHPFNKTINSFSAYNPTINRTEEINDDAVDSYFQQEIGIDNTAEVLAEGENSFMTLGSHFSTKPRAETNEFNVFLTDQNILTDEAPQYSALIGSKQNEFIHKSLDINDPINDFILFEDFNYVADMEDQLNTYNKPELDFYNIRKQNLTRQGPKNKTILKN